MDYTKLTQLLADNGYEISHTTEDGIPYVSVWRREGLLNLREATRIAAIVRAAADSPVHFQALGPSSIDFFVFTPDRTYAPGHFDAYGVPVETWIPSVAELSPAQNYDFVGKAPDRTYVDPATPSEASGYGFVWARDYLFFSNDRSGKWCVVRTGAEIDALWDQVKEEVNKGTILGACVSTASQSKSYGGTHVLCVFTPDWTNIEQVMAVRSLLRDKLGVAEEIGYKRDSDTTQGIFGGAQEWTYRA